MSFKVTIGNLDTGDAIQAQYTPTETKETHGATYAKQSPLGLPHQILQYTGGENFTLSVKFSFSGLVDTSKPVIEQRNFLLSLLVPARGVKSVRKGAPPDALLDWPGLYSFVCKLTKAEINNTLFSPEGEPTLFEASCTFEECLSTRLDTETVARFGTLRS